MSGPVTEWTAGRISAEVTLARLVLDGLSADEIGALLPAGSAVASLFARHAGGVGRVAEMLRASGVDHSGGSVDEIRLAFDRAVAVAPEASVAAYCLDDAALLARGTDEIVAWLAGEGLIWAGSEVLDVGCGIGRVSAALAPGVRSVAGVDISGGMIEEARRRHGTVGNLRFSVAGAAGPWEEADLVLFVDSMPYLVQAGVSEDGFAEAARMVRSGGAVVVLNLSYRGDPASDVATAKGWAERSGMALGVCGVRPFRVWDGAAFAWRR